jgi:thioredoxin
VGPIVDEIASDYAGRIQVAKLNTDDNPNVASRYGIRSIPTLLFFRNGEVVKTVVGAYPKAQLDQKVQEVLAG